MKAYLAVGVVIALGLALWRIDHLSAERDAQQARAEAAIEQLDAHRDLIEVQANVLAGQQQQLTQLTEIEARMRQLDQTVRRNDARQARAIEELKRHDQETIEWVRALVPAALGLQYARPETTDPADYHSGSGLPADAVPLAGSVSTAGQ